MSDFFEIWQLRSGSELHSLRFAELSELKKANILPDLSNYERMYAAPLAPETTLDALYTEFNIFRPKDFLGHSMSVSDIIILNRNGEEKPFYCDAIGFADVSQYISAEQIEVERFKAAEAEKQENHNLSAPFRSLYIWNSCSSMLYCKKTVNSYKSNSMCTFCG